MDSPKLSKKTARVAENKREGDKDGEIEGEETSSSSSSSKMSRGSTSKASTSTRRGAPDTGDDEDDDVGEEDEEDDQSDDINVVCSGRTDTGLLFAIAFDLNSILSSSSLSSHSLIDRIKNEGTNASRQLIQFRTPMIESDEDFPPVDVVEWTKYGLVSIDIDPNDEHLTAIAERLRYSINKFVLHRY